MKAVLKAVGEAMSYDGEASGPNEPYLNSHQVLRGLDRASRTSGTIVSGYRRTTGVTAGESL